MNLDDFIIPTSMASPAGLMTEAPIEDAAEVAGIPITRRAKTPTQAPTNFPAASMPKNTIARNRNGEFDYVQRRVRKTSIDDRSVSSCGSRSSHCADFTRRIAKDVLSFHHMCLPQLS